MSNTLNKIVTIFLFVSSTNISATIILESTLNHHAEGSVISFERYISLLCQGCTEEAKLPRAISGVLSFPEDGPKKIELATKYLPWPSGTTHILVDMIRDFVRVLKRALSDTEGVSEAALFTAIHNYKSFFNPEMIEAVSQLSEASIHREVQTKIRLITRLDETPTAQQIVDALCEEEVSEKDECQIKHEAFLMLNRFFTEISEQLAEGIRFCQDEKSCPAKNKSLYVSLRERARELSQKPQ